MLEHAPRRVFAHDEVDVRASRYITGVYMWMAIGVGISAAVGAGLAVSGIILTLLSTMGTGLMWGILLLQLGSVLVFSGAVNRLNVGMSRAVYLLYSVITGVTLAVASLIYTASSMAGIFAIAAMAFVGLAVFGAITKKNLGPIGTFCSMGLFMVVGLSLLYMLAATFHFMTGWLQSLNLTIGIIGILVFSGLTAWDSQRLKDQAYHLARADASEALIGSYVVSGALTMYLNFINLFFSLLRIFGQRR